MTVLQKKSQYQGRYAMLSNDGSSSDASDETAELENRDDANNSEVSLKISAYDIF